MESKDAIRPLALAIIEHDGQILVFKAFDGSKQQDFYRVLGGGIEFQETAAEALAREFREEIAAELANVRLLTVLENIFEYEGRHCHEIVFLFRADLADGSLYGRPCPILDSRQERIAIWVDKQNLRQSRFYPAGIENFIN